MVSASSGQASAAALALFEHGQREAAQRGLLLVDTKYEFGVDAGGRILLVDEIHTPDSSRRAARLPSALWLVQLCSTYKPKSCASMVSIHAAVFTSAQP